MPQVPEGRHVVSSHANAKVYERVRIAQVKRKVPMSGILDEAYKLWLDAQKEEK